MTTKRFRLQCGTIIKVDEEDAWLLRSYVWYHNDGVIRRCSKSSCTSGYSADKHLLSHVITGAQNGKVVQYRDGNRLNLTRSNLIVEERRAAVARIRALRRLYALAGA